jgi:hypothetical protein
VKKYIHSLRHILRLSNQDILGKIQIYSDEAGKKAKELLEGLSLDPDIVKNTTWLSFRINDWSEDTVDYLEYLHIVLARMKNLRAFDLFIYHKAL